jgi:hypothetical protein
MTNSLTLDFSDASCREPWNLGREEGSVGKYGSLALEILYSQKANTTCIPIYIRATRLTFLGKPT